jgi:hypothetical protein
MVWFCIFGLIPQKMKNILSRERENSSFFVEFGRKVRDPALALFKSLLDL